MSSSDWTLLWVLATLFLQGKCETTAYPSIPSYLLECYQNNEIYHRANRMPSSFEFFLDLVRKVEDSPTSRNMNARELAMALLHYMKLDGIQSIPSDARHSSNVLPFSISGAEYFRHRLTLVGLVPRIDRDYLTAFNETLTKQDMCNLHFMLSYSIDPYKREDERCSRLFEDSRGRGTNQDPGSAWKPYRRIGGHYGRNRRHIPRAENLNDLNEADEKSATKDSDEVFENRIWKNPSKFLSSRTKRDAERKVDAMDSRKFSRKRKSITAGEKSEVEVIPVSQHQNGESKHLVGEKDKFTIGDQELLSAGEHSHEFGKQSLVHMGNFGGRGGRAYPRLSQSADESFYGRVIPEIPLSDCPVVNGVITTPYGTLTIGTVIAGIAAGLNPEDIPPTKLSVDPKELESYSDRVNNIWASTLAGAVADTISSTAILDADNLQVLKGGWNDSFDPKWYLLAGNKFNHLPEVTLRGSLDGLLLGLNAKELTGRYSGLKLSQMLEAYYDNCLLSVGAEHRVQLRSKYAPDEIFRKQVHLMSLVMKKQKTSVLTVLNYSQISLQAVSKVIQHINMMDDKEKSHIGTFSSTRIANSINLVAVIDSSWSHENLYRIFQFLRKVKVANTEGNNLTVVCGKDGKVLLSSIKNIADFHNQFTKEMLMENCTRGMDLALVFDTLDTRYRKIFHDEKIQQKMNTDAQVSILFPYEHLLQENSYLIEKSKNFRSNFPDVRVMIASNGRPESFLPLVKDAKDLFSLVPYSSDPDMKYTKEFADGVKLSHQRISRPSCGSYFDDVSPGTETRVIRDVGIGNIVYYRLSPQYFYTQHDRAVITITSKHRVPLTVCHSREMERPVGPTPRGGTGNYYNPNRSSDYGSDFPPEASPYGREFNGETEGQIQCKTITSEPYKIEMFNPCEGAPSLRECNPLYISLSPPHQDTVSINCQLCRLPTNVQYEISAVGLTCYNNATVNLLSPILLGFLFILLSLKY